MPANRAQKVVVTGFKEAFLVEIFHLNNKSLARQISTFHEISILRLTAGRSLPKFAARNLPFVKIR